MKNTFIFYIFGIVRPWDFCAGSTTPSQVWKRLWSASDTEIAHPLWPSVCWPLRQIKFIKTNSWMTQSLKSVIAMATLFKHQDLTSKVSDKHRLCCMLQVLTYEKITATLKFKRYSYPNRLRAPTPLLLGVLLPYAVTDPFRGSTQEFLRHLIFDMFCHTERH